MARPTEAQFEAKYKEATSKLNGRPAVPSSDFRDHSVLTLFTTPLSWWCWPFYHLQPTDKIPMTHWRHGVNQTGAITQEWQDAGMGLLHAPIVLVASGLLVMILLILLTCTMPRSTWTSVNRPARKPVRRFSCVSFVLLWVFALLSCSRGLYFLFALDLQLARVASDLYYIRDKLDDLQPRVHNAAIWLEDWQTSCVGWTFLKADLNASLLEQNQYYIDLFQNQSYKLYWVSQKYEPLPLMLTNVRKTWLQPLLRDPWLIVILAFVPAWLPSLFILGALLISFAEDSDEDGVHVEIVLKWLKSVGVIPVVSSMMVMIVVAAVALAAGNGLGLYCAHSEHNAVNLISAFVGNGNRTSNSTTLLASFYLTGHPDWNPMVATLRNVRQSMAMVTDNLFILKPALDILGLLCGRLGFARPADLVADAVPVINQLLPMTKRDHMYGYFNELSNEGVCGHLISSIGWWVASQIFAAFFVLPYTLWLLHRHLLEHDAWLEFIEERDGSDKAEPETRLVVNTGQGGRNSREVSLR